MLDRLDSLMSIKETYNEIYVIVAPPRTSSTAFARVFWEQPSIGYYSHEPFEETYYMGLALNHVLKNLLNPLDLQHIKNAQGDLRSKGLVIKEMPYQVWHNFPQLASLATSPIVFLIRDPRLSIFSRMMKKKEVGDNVIFPLCETGWELLHAQIMYCKERHLPHLIVEVTDFRTHPEIIFKQLFEKLQLPFSKRMLSWQSHANLDIDNLGGAHSHLYKRVLTSTGIEPATETIPPLEAFPTTNGFREHVLRCLEIYETLRHDSARILAKVG
jgi:hypothetical protein